MTDEPTRNEHDALGEFSLPADAMYGIATARAAANFTVSGLRMPRPFIAALGQLKRGAALANKDLELLDPPRADAIAAAAQCRLIFQRIVMKKKIMAWIPLMLANIFSGEGAAAW